MMNGLSAMVLVMAAGMVMAVAARAEDGGGEDGSGVPGVPPALNFTVKTLEGKATELSTYRGKVVLIVNVASRCGHTKQYADLQALHEKYGERGLAVLGFPCNQFGGQEPGTAAEIQQFCTTKYGVTFDLFEKIEVNGDQAAPLYAYLTGADAPIEDQGPVKWNFEKFLLDREGRLIARFRSKVSPSSEEVVGAIEGALGPVEATAAAE